MWCRGLGTSPSRPSLGASSKFIETVARQRSSALTSFRSLAVLRTFASLSGMRSITEDEVLLSRRARPPRGPPRSRLRGARREGRSKFAFHSVLLY